MNDLLQIINGDALTSLRALPDHPVQTCVTSPPYGDGLSERFISRVLSERKNEVFVATKAGRRLQRHTADGFNRENLTAFVERSSRNLQRETLDLLQLHCPPTAVYYQPEVFEVLDELKQAGKILHYGVSVEKVEEALKAIEYQVSPRSRSFSTFSDKVLKTCFSHSHSSATLGFSSGLPLSGGLLSRKITHQTAFAADDHRNFNRHGEQF